MRSLRGDFPILSVREGDKPLIYLDNAATTQKPRAVLEAMEHYYTTDNANPHRGVYQLSVAATEDHDGARRTVAEFLNASPEEIVFTRGATESLNLAAYSYGMEFLKPGDEIALSVAEHHSNLVPWQRVARATGAKLCYLYPGRDGRLSSEEIEKKIGPKTRLVAVAQVSNVLGLENPVRAIADRAHQMGAVVVVDCAQSVPHMPVDVKALNADFAAFSGHKIYGPMGVGVLYAKGDLLDRMPPFLSGGDMIAAVHEQSATYARGPRRFEAGTQNIGGEVALAAALDYVKKIGWEDILTHEKQLIQRTVQGLTAIPHVEIYGDPTADERSAVVSFNVQDVHPHDTATILDADGITVRAGHHCAQPLMEYLGITACCRASFALYNTLEEVDAFVQSVARVRRWMGYGS